MPIGIFGINETEVDSVNRNVDVLGEPLNDGVDFRKRRAALEDQVIAEAGQTEEALENPANPEVFFNDTDGKSGLRSSGFKVRFANR